MTTQSDEPDEAIAARVTGGDSDAYAELMARYEPKLHRYATYLIHHPAAAHDVMQETFIKAYQHLQSYKPTYKFSSWLYRIAHNEAMNAVKKRGSTAAEDIETLPELGYEPHLDEQLDAEMTKVQVHRCLAKLEPKYREVVQLTYFEHMQYDEVSDVLRVPTSTVGVWLMRAKKQLRAICERAQQKGGRQ